VLLCFAWTSKRTIGNFSPSDDGDDSDDGDNDNDDGDGDNDGDGDKNKDSADHTPLQDLTELIQVFLLPLVHLIQAPAHRILLGGISGSVRLYK
jgi:hypothetical protein